MIKRAYVRKRAAIPCRRAVRKLIGCRLTAWSRLLQANGRANNRDMTLSPSEAYFDLQLQFAERYSKLTDVPLADAIGKCTNLRRRFGLWGPTGDRAWAAFLEKVPSCAQHRDLLRLTLSATGSAPTFRQSPFGCFSYDPGGADKPLRLHFMPDLRHRHSSPLASEAVLQAHQNPLLPCSHVLYTIVALR